MPAQNSLSLYGREVLGATSSVSLYAYVNSDASGL